jgi:hypothetical protein
MPRNHKASLLHSDLLHRHSLHPWLFTPPEWAYVTSQRKGVTINQGFARSLDRKVRVQPLRPLPLDGTTKDRLVAMIEVACELMQQGCPQVDGNNIHRLQKADTAGGLETIKSLSALGAPYAMLLYERFLGRPFAGHRDSVSELVGDNLESAIEDVLSKAGISYRKTKRAERIPGFDQAPDFIVPDEFNPQVVIEAKITEDDGTARDKVTRIQIPYEPLIVRPTNQGTFVVVEGNRRLAALRSMQNSPRPEVQAAFADHGLG